MVSKMWKTLSIRRLPQSILTHDRTQRTHGLHTTACLASEDYPKQHDRTTLNPESSYGTATGTDGEVAQHNSAYDPSKTSPESEMEASEEESRHEGKVSNPLYVSGANQEVSEAMDPKEGGPDRNEEKPGGSGYGWTRKHREVNTKTQKR